MTTIKKAPTIQDVARYANVSAATVSRALSAPERVSPATRERVEAAVEETGYRVNQAARALRVHSAKMILIALPNISSLFYVDVLSGVVDEAADAGYSIMVVNHFHGDPVRLLNLHLQSNRADGLLLFDGTADLHELNTLAARSERLPLVVAFAESSDDRVSAVMVDNLKSSRIAVRHLIELGHTRIGHVVGPNRYGVVNPRLEAFREVMAEAGLPIREEWLEAGDYSIKSGIDAAQQLLKLEDRPTALFVANDQMAIGVLQVLRAAGIRCPEEMSVIGFDDINISQYLVPPLTTMRQPRERIGHIAAHILIDILEGHAGANGPVRLELEAELVVRGSTAPPPA